MVVRRLVLCDTVVRECLPEVVAQEDVVYARAVVCRRIHAPLSGWVRSAPGRVCQTFLELCDYLKFRLLDLVRLALLSDERDLLGCVVMLAERIEVSAEDCFLGEGECLQELFQLQQPLALAQVVQMRVDDVERDLGIQLGVLRDPG